MVEHVTRENWGAQHGLGHSNERARDQVVIHHSWKPDVACGVAPPTEAERTRGMEEYHATVYPGTGYIAYHWLVYRDGRIHEGLGWKHTGAHVAGQNTRSIGICLVMDGDSAKATEAMRWGVRGLISWGMAEGWIMGSYDLKGHRDFSPKSCPGDLVYPELQSFRPDTEETPGSLPVLGVGDTGTDVAALQTALDIMADGIFGPGTQAAVASFQRSHGLLPDGIVGPKTWAVLLDQ